MKKQLAIKKIDKLIPADDYWMGLTFWTLANASHPATAASIVVSGNNKLVSTGVSAPPDPLASFVTDLEREAVLLHSEYFASCDVSVHGCSIYVTETPCRRCILELIDRGVKRIIYYPSEPLAVELDNIAKRGYVTLAAFNGNLNWMRDHIKTLESKGIF